ncbi:hypothetical protein F1C76_07930 [Geodermatophilaceae bacterium NBWT11]|nr:hypothetical protein F1C76_07930 [Geodermatophilaceae bacterium NBWT11]
MTTLLDGPPVSAPHREPDTDAVTLLPGRAALLDHLTLRTPAAGLVLVGLVPYGSPIGAGVLLAVSDSLEGALAPGEWLARSGAAEFAVVTDADLDDAAARLLGHAGVPAVAGLSPLTPGRPAAEVLRLAGLGLAIARLGGEGHAVRYR